MELDKINVRFKLIKPGKSKLNLVKAIHTLRHLTGFGLKQSKDFVDSTDKNYNPYQIAGPATLELTLTHQELHEFRHALEQCIEIEYELTDTRELRNKKLIQLGFYEKQDLVNELVEEDLFSILRNKDFETARQILRERYSNLSEKYLKEKLSI